MPHVIVAGRLHPSGRALLDAAPRLSVRYIEEVSVPSYAEHIHEADALLIRTQPLTAATVARAARLKIVSRHGVGYDAIDVAALNARGIVLAVCGDVNAASVAEHAAMLILAAAKRARRADEAVRSGAWQWREGLEPQELCGGKLLQVGLGRVGRRIAGMMAGFAMSVRAYDPFLQRRGWPAGAVAPVADLHEGLAWADVVSVSVPRTEGTLLGASEFGAMKQGVIVVNTARGGVLDETALVEALESGKVGAAGLDVFDEEPLPQGHPLTRFDQVLLSPHVAGLTGGAAERMAINAAQNIIDFFDGRIDPDLVVNQVELRDVR